MKLNQLNVCPFCGEKPVRHDSVGPSGFTWSTEQDQIFPVACVTKGCPPSGDYLPDVTWNAVTDKQSTLMESIFSNLEANDSPELERKKKSYRLYVMSH